MRFVLFYHSLISDWNHGNAHFLRGVVGELLRRGHQVEVYEPQDNWSLTNLRAEHGEQPVKDFRRAFPHLHSTSYVPEKLNLDKALADADVVIVHEWNDHALVRRIGEHRQKRGDYLLLFHDTHHRSVSDRAGIAGYNLSAYHGVLAFGKVIRDRYLRQGWAKRAWVWHEAADTTIFRPQEAQEEAQEKEGDIIWVGNWGDDERVAELHEFLFEPVRSLGLRARVHGVRYPADALQTLREAGIDYRGWLPNYRVPQVFARFRLTVHVPRRPYVRALPGVPTIRVFEALACGIPLIAAPWHDVEGLFAPGQDYLVARDGDEMRAMMRRVLDDPATAQRLAQSGLRTIRAQHTCAHRVDELLGICEELRGDAKGKRKEAKAPRMLPKGAKKGETQHDPQMTQIFTD